MKQKPAEQLIEAARHEIRFPTLDLTKQLLATCEIAEDNDGPVVANVDDEPEHEVHVYFQVDSEHHFLVINVDNQTAEAEFAWMQNGHLFEFCAISREHSFAELQNMISLDGVSGWSIGDTNSNGLTYRFSRLTYRPKLNYWHDFEESLASLLKDLERDVDGIAKLTEVAETKIVVARYQAVAANAGYLLSTDSIFRLNRMGLCLDIHQYISGEKLPDDEFFV